MRIRSGMWIRPGRNFISLGLVLLLLAVLSFLTETVMWLITVAMAVAAPFVFLDYGRLKRSFAQVTIDREMPVVVGRDSPFFVKLRIGNPGAEPLHGELRDVTPADAVPRMATANIELSPQQPDKTVTAAFRVPIRGLHMFGPVWLRLRGPFGFLEGQRPFECTASVKVLPEGYAASSQLEKNAVDAEILLDKTSKTRERGAGTEFESLAEYRHGDDPRRIDWRTTARYGRPIVRRYQIERHRDLMIVLDCGRMMAADTGHGTKLDCAVDASLMLSRVAVENGDRCGMGIFDDEVRGYLPPVTGRQSIRPFAEAVYALQSRWQESDFAPMYATLQSRQLKRSLIVVLSDLVDVETSRRFRASLTMLAKRHVVLFAALQTPLLNDLTRQPIESLTDGFRTAVTFRLLREREQTLHSLSRSGVRVLDVEPHQLTVPLINRFLEIRRQNLL